MEIGVGVGSSIQAFSSSRNLEVLILHVSGTVHRSLRHSSLFWSQRSFTFRIIGKSKAYAINTQVFVDACGLLYFMIVVFRDYETDATLQSSNLLATTSVMCFKTTPNTDLGTLWTLEWVSAVMASTLKRIHFRFLKRLWICSLREAPLVTIASSMGYPPTHRGTP